MWWSKEWNNNFFFKAAQPRFLPISGPLWAWIGVRVRVRVRVRARVGVRVRVRVRGWVGSTAVPLSDREVLPAREHEQHTAPKIQAANL